ncbi:MAG TPA: hypothetical protein VJ371_18975, partial [Streptosporangiaceae bacterium]|nr:hypothetical protein [Streptosporangiaceae bacterium]
MLVLGRGWLAGRCGDFTVGAMIAVLLPSEPPTPQASATDADGVWQAARPRHEGHPDMDWSGKTDPAGNIPAIPERASGRYLVSA